MTERKGDYDNRTADRHLSLVRPEDAEVEYDDISFIGPSGFEIRIIYQGDAVVRNRKALKAEIGRRATERIIR